MKDFAFNGFAAGMGAVALLVALWLAVKGYEAKEASIARDCDHFGAFIHDEQRYECHRGALKTSEGGK